MDLMSLLSTHIRKWISKDVNVRKPTNPNRIISSLNTLLGLVDFLRLRFTFLSLNHTMDCN